MTKDKDPNDAEATETSDSPDTDTVPESARTVPQAPPRPARTIADVLKSGPRKVRYIN